MRVAVILGTRPEIIKMAPIISEMKRKRIAHFVIHSGQHYSYNMDKVFFDQLKLARPKYKLDVGSGSPGLQTARIIERTEKILFKEKPDVVLVEGDTNTVLGGALAAKKLGIKTGHVEAGLRSFDGTMPEETNRILTDHCSDFLFAPTKTSQNNLIKENIPRKKIFVTGNTIVDSVKGNVKNSDDSILEKHGVLPKEFFLASVHRQENVDDRKRFASIIKGLQLVAKKYGIPVVYPIHPRSEKMAKRFRISLDGLLVIKPADYLSFLNMQKNARLVLTDSGGVQEESCILHTPCVTLRDNTERPETVSVKANIVAGTSAKNIARCVGIMLKRKHSWNNPYGNGHSAEKIVKTIQSQL